MTLLGYKTCKKNSQWWCLNGFFVLSLQQCKNEKKWQTKD